MWHEKFQHLEPLCICYYYLKHQHYPLTIAPNCYHKHLPEPPTTKVVGFSVNNSNELSITELSP
uniref:Uncharacterized protein n=1 Tax=Siphoviridae sp. ctTC45 TaxID=2827573 RepID=A0A8S5LQ94_9CAUD|nr:MAG TPA: hypothetical protein [Siphoviridae sp. ctTC45]